MSKVEKSQNKMSNRDLIEIAVYPEITYSYIKSIKTVRMKYSIVKFNVPH